MSHFTTIQVEIKDGDLLQESLQELGYQVDTQTNVRGYLWNRTPADYVIRQKNGYDIGFRKQGDRFELVSDFFGAEVDQQAFLNSLMQKYAHKRLLATARQQGYTVEAQEQLEDGTIRLVVGRWV